jgi:hypothetical protein
MSSKNDTLSDEIGARNKIFYISRLETHEETFLEELRKGQAATWASY